MEPAPSAGLGVQRYVDSPVFIDIVLVLFGAALAFGSWLKYTDPDRNLLVVIALGVGALMCFTSPFYQKRRTFAFDTTTRKLAWTSSGLKEHASGTVDCDDVRITLDPSMDTNHLSYRVMITTPQGSWPLTTGYDASDKRVEAKATELRTLLGQTSVSLLDDSVDQLTRQGNVSAAAVIVGRQRGITTAQAFDDLMRADSQKANESAL